MAGIDGLDQWQRAAALADGHCLVLAGPGSGKTTLLAARARHLLDSAPGGLCAVSFTRDSAKELAARIGADDRLLTGTFHSLALRQNAPVPKSGERTRKRSRIVDEAGRVHYVRKALQSAGADLTVESAIGAIDRFKASLAPIPTSGPEAAVFNAYQDSLKRHGLRDFQDILLDAVRAMRSRSLSPLAVRWLLVDEAQDMDEVQYAWVKAHVDAGIQTTLVADDDQSIYGWRHAMGYAGLTRFEQESKARRLVLEANYRSGATIVSTAQTVVANNTKRFQKTIRPQREDAGQIDVRSFSTLQVEADAVANALAEDPGRWGVLSRTNRRLDQVELACSARGVPFFRLGAGSFWDHPVASAVLAFTDDLVHQDGRSGIDRMAVFVEDAERSDLDAIHHGGTTAAHKGLNELLHLTPDWMRLVAEGRPGLCLRAVSLWMQRWCNDRAKAVGGIALSHMSRLEGSLSQRLQWIRQAARSARSRTGDGQATLASLHAAKGLEWNSVWMTGCEDGVLPHVDAVLDEERRLFYVGMTRARDHLVLSHAVQDAVPSRFIAEFG